MILDFSSMEETIIKNFKGGEKELYAKMFDDGRNRILYGTLEPGASIGLHEHTTNSEIIYFLEGTGKIIFDGKTFPVQKGECHYCPSDHSHSLINDDSSPLVFFAVIPEK